MDKKHKDIDLLKSVQLPDPAASMSSRTHRCKSFVVSKRFEDDEVLKPDFVKELGKVVAVRLPLFPS